MNSFQQIKALFVYHVLANPYVWIFPIVFLPQIFSSSHARYHDLGFPVSSIVTLLWLPMFLASLFFGSEIFGKASAAKTQMQICNTEFILTRAVDRSSCYWAKTAVFWCLIFVPLAVLIIIGLKQPSFTFEVKPDRLYYYLEMLPGSVTQSTTKSGNFLMSAPFGELWMNIWKGVLLISVTAISQLYMSVIATLRGARFYYWAGFAIAIALVGAPVLGRSAIEKLFLFSVNHAAILVIALVAVVAASLAISKRRSLDQEF